MKRIPSRIVIYAKDIENITGRRKRTCHTILKKIKKHYRKKKNDFITIKEFCQFFKISEDLVKDFLVD